ncbi:MAG: hypothetical protein GX567_16165, partial [Clostridia bacterium]|nr:hypothetical protein [Clostridia bacterium]
MKRVQLEKLTAIVLTAAMILTTAGCGSKMNTAAQADGAISETTDEAYTESYDAEYEYAAPASEEVESEYEY